MKSADVPIVGLGVGPELKLCQHPERLVAQGLLDDAVEVGSEDRAAPAGPAQGGDRICQGVDADATTNLTPHPQHIEPPAAAVPEHRAEHLEGDVALVCPLSEFFEVEVAPQPVAH
jgi:hypothetical protein